MLIAKSVNKISEVNNMGCHCERCGNLLPLENLWLCDDCIDRQEAHKQDLRVQRMEGMLKGD